MATQTTVRLVDDLDGSDAVETIEFTVDGKDYEIDLSEVHVDQLRDALAEFVAAARRAPAKRRGRAAAPKAGTDVSAARAWLKENGHQVKDKGRIPADLMDVYEQNKHQAPVDEAPADVEDDTPDELPPLDTSDEAVMAWWNYKGYKPQTKVSAIMRTQYLAAKEKERQGAA